MIVIEDKALAYAKAKGLSFVVKAVPVNLDCWDGTRTQVKSLKTKVVFEGEVDKELFNEFQFEGVKVFISTELKLEDNIKIIQRKLLPFTKPSFGVIGVKI